MTQDPLASALKIKLRQNLYIATLNIQGMKVVSKRKEVEQCMCENGVGILALQETHMPISQKENESGMHDTSADYPEAGGKLGLIPANLALIWR